MLNDSDDECDPRNTKYRPPRTRPGEELEVFAHCRRSNRRSECRLRNCACETEFAYKLMEFFFGGTKIEARFQHNKGFDPVKMCGSNVFHDYGENSEALMKSFGEVAEFTKRKDDRDVFTKNFENDTEKPKNVE